MNPLKDALGICDNKLPIITNLEACKLDGTWYDPVTDRVIQCDTCEGNPVCAQTCAMGALSLREE